MNPNVTPEPEAPKKVVWPVYFVADESRSMEHVIQQVNDGLRTLVETMQMHPMMSHQVWFSVIGFDHEVRCLLPLSDLSYIGQPPEVFARGTTKYSNAFRDLKDRINADVAALKAQEFMVIRPSVFFLSDGLPDDGDPWMEALADLKDSSYRRHPNILTFGLGSTDPVILAEVATPRPVERGAEAASTQERGAEAESPDERGKFAYIVGRDLDPGQAITEFFRVLTQSMVETGENLSTGKAKLVFKEPEGFVRADLID